MKLTNLSIENFKGIKSFEAKEPDRIMAFIGHNGSGKTSILDAIRFLFTGKSPLNYVSDGEVAGYVEGYIEGIGLVKRGCKNGVSFCYLDGKSCTQKALAEQIAKTFEMSVTTSSIATSSDVLREMFGGDFSKYLLSEGYMTMSIEEDEFFSMCKFSELAEMLVKEELMGAKEVSVDDITRIHAAFKDSLKAQKKTQAELEAQVKGAVVKEPDIDKSLDMEKAQTTLVAAQTALAIYKKAMADYEKQKLEIEELDKKIAAFKATPVNIPLRQEKEKAISDKRVQYTKLRSEILPLARNINEFKELIEKLATPVCPISGKLVCTTDKTPIRKELSEKIKEMEHSVSEMQNALKVLEEEGKALKIEVDAMLANEKVAKEKDCLVAQCDGMRSCIKAPMVVQDETESAQKRFDAAREQNEAILAYKKYTELVKKFEEGEKLREAYKQIVAVLEPKGTVAHDILEKAVAPLEDYCNEINLFLDGSKVEFDVSNGMKVCLRHPDALVPFDSCSSGEQFRILLIIMDMINQLSGYNVLVLDNLDVLDSDALGSVIGYLKTNDVYDNIFIAGVDTSEMKTVLTDNAVNFTVLE